MPGTDRGQTIESPISLTGDFYSIIETLTEEGVNVYFLLDESTLFLNLVEKSLSLEEVRSNEQLAILSAIAQSIALAQHFNLKPKVKDSLLAARFQRLTS